VHRGQKVRDNKPHTRLPLRVPTSRGSGRERPSMRLWEGGASKQPRTTPAVLRANALYFIHYTPAVLRANAATLQPWLAHAQCPCTKQSVVVVAVVAVVVVVVVVPVHKTERCALGTLAGRPGSNPGPACAHAQIPRFTHLPQFPAARSIQPRAAGPRTSGAWPRRHPPSRRSEASGERSRGGTRAPGCRGETAPAVRRTGSWAT